jgi:leucyl/phenylalanyl-tRNA--protein transferase
MTTPLSPQTLLSAYAQGYFPMAESRDAKEISWYYPEERGIIPLEDFHIPKSLAKFMRGMDYRISINRDFRTVITACADINETRKSTWINDEIINAYCDLHARGYAHSIEIWDANGTLIGGLYGVALGRAFFGESMFSKKPNASKVALVVLIDFLKDNDFTLLDTQYVNDHLLQFGVKSIPRAEYLEILKSALSVSGNG